MQNLYNKKRHSEPGLFLVNNYEHRLNEIMENSAEEDRRYKDPMSNFKRIFKRQTVNEEEISDFKEHSELGLEKNTKFIKRRTSEPYGLVMSPKNTQLSQAFPVQNEEVIATARVDSFSGSAKVNMNNEFKGVSEMLLTNFRLVVINKKRIFRLSFLKHIQCCIEPIISPAASFGLIHVFYPIGDDIFLRFKTQAEADKWNSDINKYIDEFNKQISDDETLDLQIYQDTNPNINSKNDPLKSKLFFYNNSTTSYQLKEMASKEFEVKDLPLSDLCLKVKLSSKLYTVNDNLKMVMLLEHLRYNNDSGDCSEHCFTEELIPSKFKFYLTSTHNTFNEQKSKKEKKDGGLGITSNLSNGNHALGSSHSSGINKISESFRYNIETRWTTVQFPQWLLAILSIIYKEAANSDGAFRVNGNKLTIEKAMGEIRDQEQISKFDSLNIHCCTGILKKILNVTEHTVLDLRDFNSYQNLQALFTDNPDIKGIKKLPNAFLTKWNELPPKNKLLLEYLIFVARYISMEISDQTKMQPSSMGTCVGQCLYGIFIPLTLESGRESTMWQNICFELMITLSVPDLVTIERLQEIGVHLDKFYRDNFPERYQAGLENGDMDATDSNNVNAKLSSSTTGFLTNCPGSEINRSSSPSSSASTSSVLDTSRNLKLMADIAPIVPPRTKRPNQNSSNKNSANQNSTNQNLTDKNLLVNMKHTKESRSLENDDTDRLRVLNNQFLSSSHNSSPFQRQTNVVLRNRKQDPAANQTTSSPSSGMESPTSSNNLKSSDKLLMMHQDRRHTVNMDNPDDSPLEPSASSGKIVRPKLTRQTRARQVDLRDQFKRHSQSSTDRCPNFRDLHKKFSVTDCHPVTEPGISFSPRTSFDSIATNEDNATCVKKSELKTKIVRSEHTII